MEYTNCLGNGSDVVEFVVLGFQISPVLKTVLFLLFLTIYIATLIGNCLIVGVISFNRQLHTPMYFFLVILSTLEIFYTTAISPTLLGSLLMGSILLSFATCIAQYYFVGLLASNECFLLTAMAFDRYVAICHPLHYMAIMSWRLCGKLVTGTWVASFSYSMVAIVSMCMLQFSGQNEIDHFFCDFDPLLKVACSDTSMAETEVFIAALIVTSIASTCIIISYVCIISAILKIPSASGRKKAFSTCSAHLTVVITYFTTLIIIYETPATIYSLNLNIAVSVVYTVATPLINPIIYTLRNKDIRNTLKKCVNKSFA